MADKVHDLDRFRRPRRWQTALAIVFTVGYVTGVCYFFELSSVLALTSTDFAGFVSGIISPLALFWLICGYFQQNTELRINSETLAAQIAEMRESVKQQTRQAQAIALTESHTKRDLIMKLIGVYKTRLTRPCLQTY
jgi:uncharacterized membrane protein YciS (DUF1049 family)